MVQALQTTKKPQLDLAKWLDVKGPYEAGSCPAPMALRHCTSHHRKILLNPLNIVDGSFLPIEYKLPKHQTRLSTGKSPPFIDYCHPSKPSMFRGFSIATFDYQMARWYSKIGRLVLHRRIACLRPWQHRRSFISNLVASGPTWHISIYCVYIYIRIYIYINKYIYIIIYIY